MKNTKKRGIIRFFVYKKGKTYVGVCLELDIVEEGENVEKLKKSLIEAAQGYVETVIKEKMDDKLLNRPAPKNYWNKYEAFLKCLRTKEPSQQACSLFKDATVSRVSFPMLQSCQSMI